MILRIDKSERDIFEKNCASFNLSTTFYTMETKPNMLQVEVLDNGREIDLLDAYSIGRMTGMEKLQQNLFK